MQSIALLIIDVFSAIIFLTLGLEKYLQSTLTKKGGNSKFLNISGFIAPEGVFNLGDFKYFNKYS